MKRVSVKQSLTVVQLKHLRPSPERTLKMEKQQYFLQSLVFPLF